MECKGALHPDVDAAGGAEIPVGGRLRARRVVCDFVARGGAQKPKVLWTVEMQIGGAEFLAVAAVAAEDFEGAGRWVWRDGAFVADASEIQIR